MKRSKFIIYYIIAAILLNTSCDLERTPLDQFSEETFWSSEENALIALTGIYKGNITFNANEMNPMDWWSYGGLIFLEFASDNAYDRRGTNSNFMKWSMVLYFPTIHL